MVWHPTNHQIHSIVEMASAITTTLPENTAGQATIHVVTEAKTVEKQEGSKPELEQPILIPPKATEKPRTRIITLLGMLTILATLATVIFGISRILRIGS